AAGSYLTWRDRNGDIFRAFIPEPSTGLLMGLGLVGLGLRPSARRKSSPSCHQGLRAGIGNSKALFASGKGHDVK
ncbi:MAG: PEP-CTERM sorting domain-containing protein, partial [Chloroflexota bacterium]|nr:PEP-CTERM sorting domain-containing protein [Chloroflexota bacterium]